MTKNEAMKLALEAAYLAGWNASGEGYNAEYPFGDHARNPEEDAAWVKNRDNALREALAEQPAQQEPAGSVYRYGKDSSGTPWHGIRWTASGLDLPDGTLIYTSPPAQQEPVAWTPINQPYPPGGELDILMGDGSILCEVLPQSDGDLWWGGASTGERFIDPKYASVTHWRIHAEHTSPPAQQEPVAWGIIASNTGRICQVELDADEVEGHNPKHIVPLYTSPPAQRTWVGLTDEEIARVVSLAGFAPDWVEAHIAIEIVRVLEAKLKEKNT